MSQILSKEIYIFPNTAALTNYTLKETDYLVAESIKLCI